MLRVLVAWDPRPFPDPAEEDLPEEEEELFGMRPGTLAPTPLCVVDPLPSWEPERDADGVVLPPRDPALVETAAGIEVYRHPGCLLLEAPALWRAWGLFKAGLRIEHLSATDFLTWSNLLLEQLTELWAADIRRLDREREARTTAKPDAAPEDA